MSASFKSVAVLCALSVADAQHTSSDRYWAQQKLDSVQYNNVADLHRWGRADGMFGATPSSKITTVFNTLGDYKAAEYANHKLQNYIATTDEIDHEKLYGLQLDNKLAESDYLSQLFSTRIGGGSPGVAKSTSAAYWTNFRGLKRHKAERAYDKALAGGDEAAIHKSRWQLGGARDYETSALAFFMGDTTIGNSFLVGAAQTYSDIALDDLYKAEDKNDGTEEGWKAVEKAEDAYKVAHFNHMRRTFSAFGDSKMSLLARVLGSSEKNRQKSAAHYDTYGYYDNYDYYDDHYESPYSLLGR